MVRVLFVCVGNICRSPTAEGFFRRLVQSRGLSACIAAESAGTTSYHLGDPPDGRALRAAVARGYDLSAIRSRHVTDLDLSRFDFILAMDNGVYADLQGLCPTECRPRLRLFMNFRRAGLPPPPPIPITAEAMDLSAYSI